MRKVQEHRVVRAKHQAPKLQSRLKVKEKEEEKEVRKEKCMNLLKEKRQKKEENGKTGKNMTIRLQS